MVSHFRKIILYKVNFQDIAPLDLIEKYIRVVKAHETLTRHIWAQFLFGLGFQLTKKLTRI